MRIGLVAAAIMTFVAGCDSAEAPPAAPEATPTGPKPGEAQLPAGGLPPFGAREELRRAAGSWKQQLAPDETPECAFTERPPSARPAGLVVTAWSGNMDLLTEGYVLGQDPSARFVEALWMKNKPVIAAREGMDDLWIEPRGDWAEVLLEIDDDQFTCRRLPKSY